MSHAKAVPDGLQDRECEKTALRKRPPIPIKKKGYVKAYEENNEAYVELRGKIKSAKAQLATLDKSAIGEAGTS